MPEFILYSNSFSFKSEREVKNNQQRNMHYLWIILILNATIVTAQSIDDSYCDSYDEDDLVTVLKSLSTNLNLAMGKINAVNQNVMDLNRRFDDINKRQDALDLKLDNFIESTQKHFTDVQKGQDTQERKLNNFMDHSHIDRHEWTTILRRQDGSVDFYRNWTEYQNGFGNPDGEFFIGLERLYDMTAFGAPQELIVILKDFDNQQRIAKYDMFKIGSETEKYVLKELGKYCGDAGDSLSNQKGSKFSTFDQDNDQSYRDCAKEFHGAWWFNSCYVSHLFGPYRSAKESNTAGMSWDYWRFDYSLKFVEMKIRSIVF